jgi:hypothetical protein
MIKPQIGQRWRDSRFTIEILELLPEFGEQNCCNGKVLTKNDRGCRLGQVAHCCFVGGIISKYQYLKNQDKPIR